MIQYLVYDIKTSQIIKDLNAIGYSIVNDPMMYNENVITSLAEIIKEHNMIAIIRRPTSIEITIPDIKIHIPKYFIKVEDKVDRTTNERHLSGVVLESLMRGKVQNMDLLAGLANDAEDTAEEVPKAEELILLEKK